MANGLKLPFLEDEEQDQFATSPLVDEASAQNSLTTPIPDFADQAPILDQEMDNASEISNQLQDLIARTPATTGELAEPQPPQAKTMLDRYAELKRLQDQRREKVNNLAYLQAGNQIAQGIASGHGGKIGDGSEAVKALKDAAGLPVEDYLVRQKDEATQMTLENEREMNDPESDISKFMRQQALAFARRPGSGFDEASVAALEKMTANQLKKLGFKAPGQASSAPMFQSRAVTGPDGKSYFEVFDMRTGQFMPTGKLAGYAPQVRTDKRTDELLVVTPNSFAAPTQVTGPKTAEVAPTSKDEKGKAQFSEFDLQNALDTKKYDQFVKTREQFASEVKEDKAAAAKVDGVIKLIEEAQKNPAAAGAASAAVARLFEKGVMTDEDVKRYAIRNGILNKLVDSFNRFTIGEFSPQLARDVASSIKVYQSGAQDSINKRAETYASQFKGAIDPKIPIQKEDIAKMIYADYAPSLASKKQGKKPAKPDSKIEEYSKQHNLTYEQAKKLLVGRGYKPNE
jgi:hypothetical protein